MSATESPRQADSLGAGSRWAALAAWSGVELAGPLAGGHRGEVMLAHRGDSRLVVRRSRRSGSSVDWEIALLDHLGERGILVPSPVPADDGRRHVDGLVVSQFIDGHPPDGTDDWRRVAATLNTLHELTGGWPQRPMFASSRRLLDSERGGDVRLDLMPARAVDSVRMAWREVQVGPQCAVHGDAGASNILITDGRAALLDWDEARVDVPWFDFAFVPDDIRMPAPPERWAAPPERLAVRAAGTAWEAATCWTEEPYYARRRLMQLYHLQARSAANSLRGRSRPGLPRPHSV